MRLVSVALATLLIGTLLATPQATATTVKHFDLKGMTSSAARVFRGTVVDVRAGKVKVGGGELPTTIYRIKVLEAFKGDFPSFKDVTYTEVEMVGSIKAETEGKGLRHFSIFRDVPRLERGQDYLLFMTRESSIALSSPVGLAQGCFEIDTSIPEEPTANRLMNAGLAANISKGPMPYAELAERVRAIVAEQGEK
nr:hypothetical protein [uncultured bacterium]